MRKELQVAERKLPYRWYHWFNSLSISVLNIRVVFLCVWVCVSNYSVQRSEAKAQWNIIWFTFCCWFYCINGVHQWNHSLSFVIKFHIWEQQQNQHKKTFCPHRKLLEFASAFSFVFLYVVFSLTCVVVAILSNMNKLIRLYEHVGQM